MTPYSFAKHHCANIFTDGSCTYVFPHVPVCKELNICLLSEDKECQYFNEFVLPIAIMPDATKDERNMYSVYMGGNARACECGTPLAPRERCCPKCRKRRRKETRRKSRPD